MDQRIWRKGQCECRSKGWISASNRKFTERRFFLRWWLLLWSWGSCERWKCEVCPRALYSQVAYVFGRTVCCRSPTKQAARKCLPLNVNSEDVLGDRKAAALNSGFSARCAPADRSQLQIQLDHFSCCSSVARAPALLFRRPHPGIDPLGCGTPPPRASHSSLL